MWEMQPLPIMWGSKGCGAPPARHVPAPRVGYWRIHVGWIPLHGKRPAFPGNRLREDKRAQIGGEWKAGR